MAVMRLRSYKWLLAVGLLGGGFMVYDSHPELRQWFRRHQFRLEGIDQALPSQVYSLETNRWLDFDIPNDTPLVRLISNASISPERRAVAGTQWPYAIEYQLRGSQGQTNATGIYHFKGEQFDFIDRQSGKPVEVNSYLERQFSPLSGRRCMLNLRDPTLTNVQTLHLRLHASHPDLLEVAVRVYFQCKVPERKIGYLWNRLSDDQKRDLVRGNVYSFEGLTDREKHGLLRFRWAVAAPKGIPGRDFQRRILYIRDDSERLQMLKDWVPLGIAVDARHRGVLPITNAPGVCQVQLVDDSSTAATEAVSSTLLWHGERQQRETNQLIWSGTNLSIFPANRDGFLEISASRPTYVRTFQAQPGQTNETTPEPVQVLAFTVSQTNTVEYAVDHTGHEPTFFRIDVRRFLPSTNSLSQPDGTVHYSLMNDNGGVIQADSVTLTNSLSAYDWLVTTNGLTNITEPQSLCFVLPPAVQALRVSSSGETVLVNAYSRPSQLVKRILVPEDYSPASRLRPEQPHWFTVRPADHLQRRAAAQYSIVRVQTRLPEYDPLIQAGNYEWESFLPDSDSRGQMILLPPVEGQLTRADSLPFSYFPVGIGCAQRVQLLGEAWERQVPPSLMLISENGSPGSATVTVDGHTLLDNVLEAPVTQIRLGVLAVGEHEVQVRAASPVSAYMNYLESATNAAYLQRYCVMATSNVLRFPYLKRDPDVEVLVLRVFSPVETNAAPFAVHLKLKPAGSRGTGPFPELTLLEREAWVTPNPVSRTRLVAATPARLDDGQPVFLRVASDVPPGLHELLVTVAATSPRWLSLSRTMPGMAEKLELSSNRWVE